MARSQTLTLATKLRRILLGAPIPTAREHHERLSLFFGLPVFASDALSSAAYATEAILSILILASGSAMGLQPVITGAICVLYVIVVVSYQQTVYAYPSGGGSYIVASDNLGEKPALIAASALLIDYMLTVAVSIAAGVAALVSAFPSLHPALVPLNCGFIALIAWANMRGVRESGALFAFPSYGFVIGMLAMIAWGVVKVMGHAMPHQAILADPGTIASEAALPFIFVGLRAFSAGCVALTGVEAISNGVQAFRAPEARNAALSLRWLAAMMIAMFLGTGYLVQFLPQVSLYSTANPEYRTVVSQIAAFTFGAGSIGFFFIQFATAAILILAANTAFADFPRLSSILARDGYLPRPLARLGDRLVFQNGIIVLAVVAIALVWYFHGELDLLLPLYAVGVFTAFTLSQTGMVRHWLKLRGKGWAQRAAVNGLGAACTGVVAVVILATKFVEGAWIVLVLITITSVILLAIKRRYKAISDQLAIMSGGTSPPPAPSAFSGTNHPIGEGLPHPLTPSPFSGTNHPIGEGLPHPLTPSPFSGTNHPKNREGGSQVAILLVPRVHRGIIAALDYARELHADVRGLHITINKASLPEVRQGWETFADGVPLVVLESPYRSLIDPILEYIDQMIEEKPDRMITVIVPEAVATKWAHKILQENVAQQIKSKLGRRKNVVVANVRYFLA